MTTDALDFQRLPLDAIDPPELAQRETFDEAKLVELAEDIRRNGLIQPIVVRPKGDRYEIIAGHRRSIACRMANLLNPPCWIRRDADGAVEAWKMSENAHREDVNAGEEAVYLQRVLERDCMNDVERLCQLTGFSFDYVSKRLNLLTGDELVLGALKEKHISLGVAEELNRIKDRPSRVMYLKTAIDCGSSVRQVRQWRKDAELFTAMQEQSAASAGEAVVEPLHAGLVGPRCEVCLGNEEPHTMQLFYIHVHCYKAILSKMLAAYHGSANG